MLYVRFPDTALLDDEGIRTHKHRFPASYSAHVHAAAEFCVSAGVNQGDSLGASQTLCPGDIYRFTPRIPVQRLAIHDPQMTDPDLPQALMAKSIHVAQGSEIGQAGSTIICDSRLTLMDGSGTMLELLVLRIRDPQATQLVFIALSAPEAQQSYTLLDVAPAPNTPTLPYATPAALARGTAITLANGHQRRIEDLCPGDKVLSRNNGSCTLRAVEHCTLRAVGPHAPVVVPRQSIGNHSDLIVSQPQRLLLQDRNDGLGCGLARMRAARDLAPNGQIYLRPGGFIDYYHLIFEHPEIIYAECIAVECASATCDTNIHTPAVIQ